MTHRDSLLIISTEAGYGGAERCIEIILRHLPAGLRVGVLAESPLHVAQLRAQARPEVELAVVSTKDEAAHHKAVRRFISLHQRLRPRAVLVNSRPAARILAAAARFLPGVTARSFVYIHDLLWENLGEVMARLPGATALVPDAFVLLRPGYLEPYVVPRGPARAMVMPNPVELPASPAPPAGPEAPMLHLATVNAFKGHRHLIATVALLNASGRTIRVRSIGYRPERGLVAALEEEIDRQGVRGQFSLEDYVADPEPLLRECLGVVIASVSHSGGPETFGRTMIEAWAHGRPVIAFAAGAPARLIRHMEDGILVPEGDERALAEALHRLAADAALRERLGRNGLARVRREFAAEVLVPRLLDILLGRSSETGAPPSASRPETASPHVLLDVTETLNHGWLTPIGLTRVEAEVIETLRATSDVRVEYVRHDATLSRFVPLSPDQADWLDHRFGGAERFPPPPPPPPARWLRHDVLALIGLATGLLPDAALRFARRAWKALEDLRNTARPASLMPADTGPVALPPGDAMVSVANPWSYASPEWFQRWHASGRRLVLVLHDLIPLEAPHLVGGPDIRSFVARMMAVLAEADRIIAVSEYTAGSYIRAVGGRLPCGTTLSVVHPPIVPEIVAEGATVPPAGLSESRPFVLFCSTIEVRKNHLLLLHLWEKLRCTLPADRLPRLVFVGRWGWGVDAVRLWVECNWRLAPHLLVMEGVRDQELAYLYRHALFTVFPSHAEGFGMPVAESLSCGTPVVTGNHPALIEAAEALMPAIDPLDFPAWEREVTRLITDQPYLDELRRRARLYKGHRTGDIGSSVIEALGFKPSLPR